MRRRDFIKVIRSSAAAWPFAARAQQQMPVIGWLFGVSAQAGQPPLTAFRKALGAEGFVEGQNVQIEYRWADGQYDKLPAMAADLVAKSVRSSPAAAIRRCMQRRPQPRRFRL
jgi:putative ABC transport system substrate-binding protein